MRVERVAGAGRVASDLWAVEDRGVCARWCAIHNLEDQWHEELQLGGCLDDRRRLGFWLHQGWGCPC